MTEQELLDLVRRAQMDDREILVALVGGPMDGRVLPAECGETLIEVPETGRWGMKYHVYKVQRHQDEIVEGFFERTRHG